MKSIKDITESKEQFFILSNKARVNREFSNKSQCEVYTYDLGDWLRNNKVPLTT